MTDIRALIADDAYAMTFQSLGQYRSALLAALYAAPAASQSEPAPVGSGGWEAHAKELERELAYWKQRAKTMLEHQDGECWYWQGDGTDHPESMVDSLPVVIRADALRSLMAPAAQQPLTDGQIDAITEKLDPIFLDAPANFLIEFARAIEQAHEIGVKDD